MNINERAIDCFEQILKENENEEDLKNKAAYNLM
jgi:hypothetical protein